MEGELRKLNRKCGQWLDEEAAGFKACANGGVCSKEGKCQVIKH